MLYQVTESLAFFAQIPIPTFRTVLQNIFCYFYLHCICATFVLWSNRTTIGLNRSNRTITIEQNSQQMFLHERHHYSNFLSQIYDSQRNRTDPQRLVGSRLFGRRRQGFQITSPRNFLAINFRSGFNLRRRTGFTFTFESLVIGSRGL